MNTAFCSGDKLEKMNFTEQDVTMMHAELAAIRERVHKLILFMEFDVSQIRSIAPTPTARKACSLEEKQHFVGSEVLAERQRRIQGHVCSVDNPEHDQIEVCFEPRRPPSPLEFIESMWSEVNRLRQELLPP